MIPLGVLASSYVAPAGGGVSFEYLTSAINATSTKSHTFSGMALGTAASDRTIIIAASHRYGSPSAVTIGGVSATQDILHTGGSSTFASLWRATVPTGTTGDVVVTIATAAGCGIGVYRIDGAVTVPSTNTIDIVQLSVEAGDFCITVGTTTSTSMTLSGGTLDYLGADIGGVYPFSGSTTAISAGTLSLNSSSALAMSGAAYRLA